MRAARFHDWDGVPVVDDVPEPVLGAGEVLVSVQAAAVAHLDVTVATGTFGMHPPLPYIGGVEGAGVVVSADPATGLAEGTQVVLRGAGLGMKRDGTWTELVSVPAKAVMPLAEPLPPEVAATFFVPATTGHVAVHDIAGITRDDHVIVAGAGGSVGSMAAQLAVATGAHVVGTVGREADLARLPAGVEGLVLADSAATARLTKERPASVLIDTLGGPELIARTRWVRQGGRAVLIGYVLGTEAPLDLPTWLLDDVALLPVNMIRRERQARQVAVELLGQLAAGTVHVDTQRFDLADIGSALTALRGGRVRGRAVVTAH